MSYLSRFSCLLLAFILSTHAKAQDDRAAATEALVAYLCAFVAAVKTGDAAAVSQHLTEPYVLFEPSETTVFATRTDYEAWLKPVLATLRERGYDHIDWPQLDLALLSKDLAIASVLVVRYRADGTEFGRIGVTYLMRKVEGRWKIISLTAHDTTAVLRLDTLRPNPSVKGTCCGKPQAAPYLER